MHLKKIIPYAFMVLCLTAATAYAENISFNFGQGKSTAAQLIHILIVLSVISLAPSIIIMATSFTRIAVVLSFLRSSLGLQQSPPNIVLISLALFLTGFIMTPTFEKAYKEGVAPLMEERISEEEAWQRTTAPMQKFMLNQVRENDLKLFSDLAKVGEVKSPEALPLRVVVPAFMISELRRAFEIGFLIFIPFLIIDLVVASILMAMGMMMLPPVMISLPFKLIFFVLIDGWSLIAGSLVRSFH